MYNYDQLLKTGISYDDAVSLRRISMTLHRWHELECGDGNDYASWAIERDEQTGKPYMVRHVHTGKTYMVPIADRETGAIKRLKTIMAKYPDLEPYIQTDPRGAALYIITPRVKEWYGKGNKVGKFFFPEIEIEQ